MKKIVVTILTLVMMLTAFTAVYASDEISVLLNDKEINFVDENGNAVYPQLINDRTMVPMRKIFEVLNMNVSWNGETQTVTATNGEKTIVLTIGSEVATVETADGKNEIILDSVPVIINDRTLVPVRFVAESLGIIVGWDGETQTVIMLDTSFMLEIFKEKAPTFYELLNLEREAVETFDMNFDATATINYTDSANKSNNNNLKMIVNGNEKMSENAFSLDLTSKVTGKGEIYDQIKELGFADITLKTILDIDNLKVYVKSSLLKEMVGNKWAALILDFEELDDLDLKVVAKMDAEDIIAEAFSNINVTADTYSEVAMATEFVCRFLSDDFLKVSGRTAKTYEYAISLKDILNIIGLDDESAEESYKLEIKLTSKLSENNIAEESKLVIKGSVKSGTEKIDAAVEASSKMKSMNEKVSISMPKDSEVELIKN